MDKVPVDLAVIIAGYLPRESLLDCALVSKGWHRLFTQSALFRALAIQFGASSNAAAEGSKEWRRIWWHEGRIVMWPCQRAMTDGQVRAFLDRSTHPEGFDIAFINPTDKPAYATALWEMCTKLVGSRHMVGLIPPTPRGLTADMPLDGDFVATLARYGCAIVGLYRSRLPMDRRAEIYVRKGHLKCLVFHSPDTVNPESVQLVETDAKLNAVLELRPRGTKPSAHLLAEAKRLSGPFISIISAPKREDILWAIEQMAEWGAQCSGTPLAEHVDNTAQTSADYYRCDLL